MSRTGRRLDRLHVLISAYEIIEAELFLDEVEYSNKRPVALYKLTKLIIDELIKRDGE